MATLRRINTGTAANDGTGDPLRTAIQALISNTEAINREVIANTTTLTGVDPGRHIDAVSYDPATETLTFTRENNATIEVSLAAVPSTALLSNLRLTTITSPINDSTSLEGDHTATFHISGASQLGTIALFVNTTQVHAITNPTSDGSVTVNFNISSGEWSAIIAGSPANLDFQIRGTDSGAQAIQSNTVRIVRIDDSNSERVFYGLSASNNPDSIDIGTLSSHVLGSVTNDVFNVDLGPTTAGQYIIFLVPADRTLAAIRNRQFNNVNVLSAFTQSSDIRTIDSQLFDAAVFGPVNAGFSVQYEVDING